VAIMAILVVGTLVAADIIHFGRREPADRTHRLEDPKPGNLAVGFASRGKVDLWGMDSFPASDPPQNW
jgi:hypothetical protein